MPETSVPNIITGSTLENLDSGAEGFFSPRYQRQGNLTSITMLCVQLLVEENSAFRKSKQELYI